ncbi:MAG: hypothetical protein ABWK05_00855 [Pyrobaculum sp.]
MRGLWLTYAFYWAAMAAAAAAALAGTPIIPPDQLKTVLNQTASAPYLDRLAATLGDVALVAAVSYPALLYLASGYGAVTAALIDAVGLGQAFTFAAVAHVVLYFYYQLARWHPLAQKLGKREKISWRQYLLWLVLSASLVGVLSL